MSGQYLEAHTFLKTLRDKGVPYTETLVNLMQYAVIEDVAPVVHAHWIKLYNHIKCSNCGVVFFNQPSDKFKTYCSKCGARMDGKEE